MSVHEAEDDIGRVRGRGRSENEGLRKRLNITCFEIFDTSVSSVVVIDESVMLRVLGIVSLSIFGSLSIRSSR